MTPSQLAAQLPFGPNPPKDVHVYISIAIAHLADNLYEAEFADGRPLCLSDIGGTKEWLREYAESLNLAGFPSSAETSATTVSQTRLRVTGRVRAVDETWCVSCGHEDHGKGECGKPIGGGRHCQCCVSVPA